MAAVKIFLAREPFHLFENSMYFHRYLQWKWLERYLGVHYCCSGVIMYAKCCLFNTFVQHGMAWSCGALYLEQFCSVCCLYTNASVCSVVTHLLLCSVYFCRRLRLFQDCPTLQLHLNGSTLLPLRCHYTKILTEIIFDVC